MRSLLICRELGNIYVSRAVSLFKRILEGNGEGRRLMWVTWKERLVRVPRLHMKPMLSPTWMLMLFFHVYDRRLNYSLNVWLTGKICEFYSTLDLSYFSILNRNMTVGVFLVVKTPHNIMWHLQFHSCLLKVKGVYRVCLILRWIILQTIYRHTTFLNFWK